MRLLRGLVRSRASGRLPANAGSTLLLDGDDTRNATAWGKRGKGFPFKVADEVQAARLARNFTHTVIDTGQRPSQVDLKALSEGCDLLVIPAVPASLDTDGLVLTLQALTLGQAFHDHVSSVRIAAQRHPYSLRLSLRRNGRKELACRCRSDTNL